MRSLRYEYYSKENLRNQGDMEGTWKILRKAMNKEAKQSDTETIFGDNKEVNDKQEISERFNDHFVTIGEKLAKNIPQSSKCSMEYLSKTNKNENKFIFKCRNRQKYMQF